MYSVVDLVQTLFYHVRLYQGRLQGNPDHKQEVHNALHAANVIEPGLLRAMTERKTTVHSTIRSAATLALAFAMAFGALSAKAHDNAYLDTLRAPNGGQVRMTGMYHYELVVVKNSKEVKENPVQVFVTDHAGEKIATAGAAGHVTLLAGKLKASVTLAPDGDNRLKGMAKYASRPDMKAVVSITLAGKPPEQARFTPLAGVNHQHMEH